MKLLRGPEIAREQTALSWELRIAMSLASYGSVTDVRGKLTGRGQFWDLALSAPEPLRAVPRRD